MTLPRRLPDSIRKQLTTGGLPFRDFMEVALYDPELGYYSREQNPVGREGDFVTAPALSPLFSFALSELIREFVSRSGDEVSTIVDIGCGDGSLIHSLYVNAGEAARAPLRLYGVDRSLARVNSALSTQHSPLRFVHTLDEVPGEGRHLIIANELFDAFPFARLVQRGDVLHELLVVQRDGALDWGEREAPVAYKAYFGARGIDLADGQFVDVSLEWESYYSYLCRFLRRGFIVTFDYGLPERKLFDARFRRFGTAASYKQHRVTRDLLSDPGERDLTAHINFTDLIRAGEREGLRTLYFDRQAKFLLALGAANHDALRPLEEWSIHSLEEGMATLEHRDDARRLLLPDGIGDDIRVLVQEKGSLGGEWSFQRPLFRR